jgi:hypothetical protein
MPLPTFGSTFTATLTRGFWFQAPVGFTIVGLRVPNEAGQAFQVVEVIDLGGAPPPAYPGTVTGTQLFYDNATPAGTTINTAITIAPNAYIGILGACTSTVGSNNSYNSYASSAGAFTSDINGTPVTLTRFGTQFGIGAGGNQPCWQEAAGQLSRVEVFVAPATGFASAIPYGTGCINVPDVSFYENFTAASGFDLANSSMTLLHTGTGYLAIPGTTTYVAPSGSAQILALTDDSETQVTLTGSMPVGSSGSTSSLTVCSNGFVSAATGNGTAFTPDPAAFLNGPQAWWSIYWHDMNPGASGSGSVKFEQVGTMAYVTWDGVYDFAGPNPNTFQAQFDVSTGTVHYVYGTVSGLGNGVLTGFSSGGASADPGSMDISAALPATFNAATFARVPLAHTTSARPVVGTTFNLLTTNVPLSTAFGVQILGLTEFTTGVDLTALGMPTCNLYTSLDATPVWLPSAGTGSTPFTIPNNPVFAGFVLLSQSAAFVPGINAFGAITSNGMRLTVDLL